MLPHTSGFHLLPISYFLYIRLGWFFLFCFHSSVGCCCCIIISLGFGPRPLLPLTTPPPSQPLSLPLCCRLSICDDSVISVCGYFVASHLHHWRRALKCLMMGCGLGPSRRHWRCVSEAGAAVFWELIDN